MYNHLTQEEEHILLQKGTERAFSGEYEALFTPGTYVCRRCNQPLFDAAAKFHSGCGWPSFDAHLPGAVSQRVDADGRRTEILCANCGGHLGHVFHGERMTDLDTRHCVNSRSTKFFPAGTKLPPVLHE